MSVFFFNVTKNKQYSENYLMLNADAIADIYKSARDIFESVRDIFRKYESARDNCPWHFLKIWPWHFFLYPWQFPVKCPWHLKVPVTNLKKKNSRPRLNVTGKKKNTDKYLGEFRCWPTLSYPARFTQVGYSNFKPIKIYCYVTSVHESKYQSNFVTGATCLHV